VLFGVYKVVLFENRVMRIMFGLKTEEMGGKGCIMWSFMIYTACQILGYQRTVEKWVRNVAGMGMKVILNRFFIGKLEGKGPFRRPYENGRITFQLILRNCMRVGCDYSCFGRALNDILVNCVLNCKLHKILGNILIS
jgi:hypothetical protein